MLIRFLILTVLMHVMSGNAVALSTDNVLEQVPFNEISEEEVFDRKLWNNKRDLLKGIVGSIRYLNTDGAKKEYQHFEKQGLSREKVISSLWKFCFLLISSDSYEEARDSLRSQFDLYRSPGRDGIGTVKFTGYFQPVYQASRIKTDKFQFPVFRKPADFKKWQKPHPTRVMLEGYDGKAGEGALLKGSEIAWLKNRFEVLMIHIQGSSVLEFPDGELTAVGFAAGTDHPFKGISSSFLRKHKVLWHNLGKFFKKNPDKLNEIMARNNRFILFAEKDQPDPVGSFGVPVIEEQSIAIDRYNLPPGALGIVRTRMPAPDFSDERLKLERTSRIVLNLDTGSAIKGPGRADIFMGTGRAAQVKASSVYNTGELYYLFAK